MGQRSSYPEGVPSWVDLMTIDPPGSRRFYGALFGWSFDISPDAATGNYTQCQLGDLSVAGMGGQPVPGMPTVWTTYFAVDDADKVAERIREHGGTLQMEPMSIGPHGRMAIATDPTGAVFGLWQAGSHPGAQLVNVPGAVVWNELSTPDLDAAARFYAAVFGLEWESVDAGPEGPPYRMMRVDGRPTGGAMQVDGAAGGVPPHWMVYFDVSDVDGTVRTATDNAGEVVLPAHDSPQGRWAVLRDPQGGTFSVISAVDADE